MGRWRPFLSSTSGKISLSVLILLCIATLIYSVSAMIASDDPAALSRQGLFIDATTGKAFRYTIQVGDKIPITAPSGQRTGYPAEGCYWTREGTLREEPFPVLLNHYLGKSGPTFCPDCDRIVKPHNARPLPDEPAPPTRAEYALRIHDGSAEE